MNKLEILSADYKSGINDYGISKLNLEVLHASFNPNITNVNHTTKLETLTAKKNSGIGDEGIKDLNLKILYADDNPKITNLNHMTNLEKLYILTSNTYPYDCGVTDSGIFKLTNLKVLDA